MGDIVNNKLKAILKKSLLVDPSQRAKIFKLINYCSDKDIALLIEIFEKYNRGQSQILIECLAGILDSDKSREYKEIVESFVRSSNGKILESKELDSKKADKKCLDSLDNVLE
ncbi:hypothetical protein HN748_04835 [Candidatus Peregrinibacteria bacterium]|nr:hypothetical protein [Candidatus Peregrinibacteria bacterium]